MAILNRNVVARRGYRIPVPMNGRGRGRVTPPRTDPAVRCQRTGCVSKVGRDRQWGLGRSCCIACGAMEPTSSGQARRWRPKRNNLPEFRESGSDVPVGTAASARSTEALRCLIEASASSTLIRQRPPTPLCRGPSPYCGENSEPDRYIKGELDSQPRDREHPRL